MSGSLIEQGSIQKQEEFRGRLAISPRVRVVKSLQGYQEDVGGHSLPVWGEDNIALWHSVSGETVCSDHPLFWETYRSLATGDSDGLIRGSYDNRQSTIVERLRLSAMLQKDGIESKVSPPTENRDTAEAYFHLTQSCNFSCHGCCTGSDIHGGAGAQMLDDGLAKKYIWSLAQSAQESGFRRLRLKYAGGEPTLNKPFRLIQGLQDTVAEARFAYPDLAIDQTVLSNGVPLDKDKINFLRKSDIHLAISLWGVDNQNALARVPRNGEDDFQKIVHNIRASMNAGLAFNLLTVVGPDSGRNFAELIKFLWDRESDKYIGGINSDTPIPLAVSFFRPQNWIQREYMAKRGSLFVDSVRYGFAEMNRLVNQGIPISPPDRWDYLNLFGAQDRTCGSGHNYVAVGPNGIGACHEETSIDLTDRISRMRDGENIFTVAASTWEDPDILKSEHIHFSGMDVQLENHGGGGCPRERKAQGDITGTTQITTLYSALSSEILALEAKRRLVGSQTRTTPQVRQRLSISSERCTNCGGDGTCGLHNAYTNVVAVSSINSGRPTFQKITEQLEPEVGFHDTQSVANNRQHVYLDCNGGSSGNNIFGKENGDLIETRGHISVSDGDEMYFTDEERGLFV